MELNVSRPRLSIRRADGDQSVYPIIRELERRYVAPLGMKALDALGIDMEKEAKESGGVHLQVDPTIAKHFKASSIEDLTGLLLEKTNNGETLAVSNSPLIDSAISSSKSYMAAVEALNDKRSQIVISERRRDVARQLVPIVGECLREYYSVQLDRELSA